MSGAPAEYCCVQRCKCIGTEVVKLPAPDDGFVFLLCSTHKAKYGMRNGASLIHDWRNMGCCTKDNCTDAPWCIDPCDQKACDHNCHKHTTWFK